MNPAPAQFLVAEQDSTWSKPVARWLRAQGHQVCIAVDGCEVLTLVLRHDFDALLIDLDLPTINGLDVANSIRRSEQGTGRRMAIIGLARPEAEIDREVLIECGLDATLRKPFSEAELTLAVQSILFPTASATAVAAPAKVAPPEPALADVDCIDREKLAEFIESDAELFTEMVALLIQEYPRRMNQIRGAIEQRDGKTLERGAHTLKGSLSYFCSKALIERLQRLENLGRTMDFTAAGALHAELDGAFPRLKQALQAAIPDDDAGSANAHVNSNAGAA